MAEITTENLLECCNKSYKQGFNTGFLFGIAQCLHNCCNHHLIIEVLQSAGVTQKEIIENEKLDDYDKGEFEPIMKYLDSE